MLRRFLVEAIFHVLVVELNCQPRQVSSDGKTSDCNADDDLQRAMRPIGLFMWRARNADLDRIAYRRTTGASSRGRREVPSDVPVVQLSIDETRPASFHFEIGKKLSTLRDQAILIMGSGNLVHNLHTYGWGRQIHDPYDWAIRFETTARQMIMTGDYESLINYERLGPDALLSIPTPDHYFPLLYILGSRRDGEAVAFPVEGVDGGSISMLTVKVG